MTKKIFLADDDRDDWFIIEDAMSQVDATGSIEFFIDGRQLIDQLNQSYSTGSLPCLVVLDLNMPKMNGTETLAVIKNDSRYQDIPVIIYSTSINFLEKQKCMELGAQNYVTKPTSALESKNIAMLFNAVCEKTEWQSNSAAGMNG